MEEEMIALKSRIAELESEPRPEKTEKIRNMKRNLFVKGQHAHPDSGSSDPRPSSKQAFRDLETEDNLQSFTDMSISEVEELISLSPQKEVITDPPHKPKSKKKSYIISSHSAAAPQLTQMGARHKLVQVQIAVKLTQFNCWYAR